MYLSEPFDSYRPDVLYVMLHDRKRSPRACPRSATWTNAGLELTEISKRAHFLSRRPVTSRYDA